jgi:hypothetical protein
MRFAIWAAVSKKEQAALDKVSLQEQETKCRLVAEQKGWTESAGAYIAPGASRSFYVNLSDAEADIPALRQMLEDARNNKFDVLVLYSYDRLGDLVDMVAHSLRFYGKQLYSITQPAEPQDPKHFDPYKDSSEAIMRDVARIWQRQRIDDLRRKWFIGMPDRVKKGLNPLRVPFGYKWKGKKVPPELLPDQAALLLKMKDMFLAGESLLAIAREINKFGIPTSDGNKWNANGVRYCLSNPYYAGFVTFNRSVVVRDPRLKRKRKEVPQPRSKWLMEKGKHKAVWDKATYEKIMEEIERRKKVNQKFSVRHPFSGLLYCSECGKKLYCNSWWESNYQKNKVLACSDGTAHVIINYHECVEFVAWEVTRHFQKIQEQPLLETNNNDVSQYEAAIEELKKRRGRVQEGFEAGLYDKIEASERLNSIDSQISDLRDKIDRRARSQLSRKDIIKGMQPIHNGNAKAFARWLLTHNPKVIHRYMTTFFEKIIVSPDRKVEIIEK